MSFWVAGIENDAVLKVIQRRLTAAAERGLTYRDWLKEMDGFFEKLPASRPATVFRTNLYSAYSAGQLEQIAQMQGRFPKWRYLAILDSLTRHRDLNDKIFEEGQGPYPPIDYNCRCTAQHLHTFQVDAEGISTSPSVKLPPTVRRFDLKADFATYLTRKQAEMHSGMRRNIRDSLSK